MDRLEVSTDVYVSPREAYEFLVDFPQYARYSKHLERVEQHGDGTPGTEYDLILRWWKLSYTAHSEVTDVDPPRRIDWRIVEDIDATGQWLVEHVPDATPDGYETATRVRFVVEFDTSSARADALDLPGFVSFGWVLDRVKPKVLEEATRVVERIVADLEGEHRDVELQIHETPSL